MVYNKYYNKLKYNKENINIKEYIENYNKKNDIKNDIKNINMNINMNKWNDNEVNDN